MRTIFLGGFAVLGLVMALSWSSAPGGQTPATTAPAAQRAVRPALPDGTYDVQSVSYDDATGAFRVLVLGTPPGVRPVLESDAVKMARLPDDAVGQGVRARLVVEGGQPVVFLAPGFQVAYTHAVTTDRVDPSTGQRETVVVSRESSSWTPFMASMAGSMVAHAMFTPQYVLPPAYAPGGLAGVGGYGSTPAAAAQSFQQRTGQLPTSARLSASGAGVKRLGPGSPALGRSVGSSKLQTSPANSPRPKGKAFGSSRRR
jgi:hypothetical protein